MNLLNHDKRGGSIFTKGFELSQNIHLLFWLSWMISPSLMQYFKITGKDYGWLGIYERIPLWESFTWFENFQDFWRDKRHPQVAKNSLSPSLSPSLFVILIVAKEVYQHFLVIHNWVLFIYLLKELSTKNNVLLFALFLSLSCDWCYFRKLFIFIYLF